MHLCSSQVFHLKSSMQGKLHLNFSHLKFKNFDLEKLYFQVDNFYLNLLEPQILISKFDEYNGGRICDMNI